MKFGYKVIHTNPKYRADEAFENSLNKLGSEGWELVGVRANALYFKRPLRTTSEAEILAHFDTVSWPPERHSEV